MGFQSHIRRLRVGVWPLFFMALSILIGIFLPVSHALTVSLKPLKDNSIFGDSSDVSNGKGDLYIGNNGAGMQHRAFLKFDLTSIPAGSTINSASLSLVITKAPFGSDTTPFTVHRVTEDWGEGNSGGPDIGGTGDNAQTGDVTWMYAFYPTTVWGAIGGSFVSTPIFSGILAADTGFLYNQSFSIPTSAVKAFVDQPSTNFGWVILGDETDVQTARRLGSRETTTAFPLLTVEYSGSATTTIATTTTTTTTKSTSTTTTTTTTTTTKSTSTTTTTTTTTKSTSTTTTTTSTTTKSTSTTTTTTSTTTKSTSTTTTTTTTSTTSTTTKSTTTTTTTTTTKSTTTTITSTTSTTSTSTTTKSTTASTTTTTTSTTTKTTTTTTTSTTTPASTTSTTTTLPDNSGIPSIPSNCGNYVVQHSYIADQLEFEYGNKPAYFVAPKMTAALTDSFHDFVATCACTCSSLKTCVAIYAFIGKNILNCAMLNETGSSVSSTKQSISFIIDSLAPTTTTSSSMTTTTAPVTTTTSVKTAASSSTSINSGTTTTIATATTTTTASLSTTASSAQVTTTTLDPSVVDEYIGAFNQQVIPGVYTLPKIFKYSNQPYFYAIPMQFALKKVTDAESFLLKCKIQCSQLNNCTSLFFQEKPSRYNCFFLTKGGKAVTSSVRSGLSLVKVEKYCVKGLIAGTIETCSCGSNCLICAINRSTNAPRYCIKCRKNYLYNGECIETCPADTIPKGKLRTGKRCVVPFP